MEATTPCERRAHPGRRLPPPGARPARRCTSAIMRQMQPVLSRLAGAEQNRERLESLGTMAAGLAHELNNPAAAVKRAASDLADALEVISATIGQFVEAGRRARRRRAARRPAARGAGAREAAHEGSQGLDAADAEDAMLERLEDLGVPEPWRVAEPLAAAGVDDGLAGGGERARGLRDRRRGALGGRVADRARPRRRAARLGVADGRPRDRDQVLRLHGPRRRWWRPTSTRASRRR